ncbi:TylF/MycF/NovP-related O-methyltransferase [Sporosarcina psychrophila]|uniref:TylF/MycF/NovP-related O-methyltransferase n=1 Tax=Sporosarcina psychrophila TaxID=1476 RepID=UPI0030D03D00
MNSIFEIENEYYQKCSNDRISKLIAHYELYKMSEEVAGNIVEAGVFKGSSLIRFATFREIFGAAFTKKIIAFDSFGNFPDTDYEEDKKHRENFIKAAGTDSLTKSEINEIIKLKKFGGEIELVKGDIRNTVPEYVNKHPELRISLLHIDVDVYEPTKVLLEELYSKVVKGGIVILDDYGVFPGETQAVDEFFKNQDLEIKKFSFAATPCYFVKK